METAKRRYGDRGEAAAAEWLIEQGWHILFRNYTCKLGEIDLVVKKGDCLSFVEVKSRHNTIYGCPAEAVTQLKQRHIRRVAQYCLLRERTTLEIDKHTDFRFDVCEVVDTPQGTQISYIENAF